MWLYSNVKPVTADKKKENHIFEFGIFFTNSPFILSLSPGHAGLLVHPLERHHPREAPLDVHPIRPQRRRLHHQAGGAQRHDRRARSHGHARNAIREYSIFVWRKFSLLMATELAPRGNVVPAIGPPEKLILFYELTASSSIFLSV